MAIDTTRAPLTRRVVTEWQRWQGGGGGAAPAKEGEAPFCDDDKGEAAGDDDLNHVDGNDGLKAI